MSSCQAKPLRSFAVLLGLMLLTLATGCRAKAPPAGSGKPGLPDAEEQARKEKEIEGLFPDIKDPGDLAENYYDLGLKTRDDPAGRFVLLKKAAGLFAEAGEPKRAEKAIDDLAKDSEVDVLVMKKDALVKSAKAKRQNPDDLNFDVAEEALKNLTDAINADRYDIAGELAALAESTCKKGRSQELEEKVAVAVKNLQEVQKQFEAVKEARDALQNRPDEPDANREWGKFLCFIKGNWEQGLPLLAKGSDVELKTLALRDFKEPPSKPDEQVKLLGDAWWDLAAKEQGLAKTNLQMRALYWYKKNEERVTGLTQSRVKSRIRQLTSNKG